MKEFRDRRKAFAGAIMAVASLAGSAINAMQQHKAYKQQQQAETYKNNIDSIAALNQAYANQDYINDFENKVTYKYGGTPRKRNGEDRLIATQTGNQFSNPPIFRNRYQKYKCGGRR